MNTRKLKLVLIGLTGSGKTALLERLRTNTFQKEGYKTTVGVDFYIYNSVAHHQKFHIWDTAGGERFKVITDEYVKGSDIYFFTVDAEKFSTEKKLIKAEITRCMQLLPKRPVQCNIIITKSDLKSADELASMEKELNEFCKPLETSYNLASIAVHKTSAKTDDDVGLTNLIKHSAAFNPDEAKLQILTSQKRFFETNICEQYLKIIAKRVYFSTDPTRRSTVQTLSAALEAAKSMDEVKECLISAARDIRTPVNNIRKYGVTFFFGWLHIGSYTKSQLYKLIDQELKAIDPKIDLEKLSTPPPVAKSKPDTKFSPAGQKV
jgi:small GTP-binding protein